MQKVLPPSRPPSPTVFLSAALAGPVLGILSVPVAVLLPSWIGTLFTDASAGWCAVALLLGMWAGTRLLPWQVPLAGAVALLSAVVCYYAVRAVFSDGSAALLNPVGWLLPAWLWLLAGCVAGPLPAVAGAWIRDERRSRRLVGLGLLGGVFLADALLPVLDWVHFRIVAPEVPEFHAPGPMFAQSVFVALVGIALVLVVAHRPGDRPRALAVMVPAGLVWYVGVWGAQQVMFMSGMGYFG